MKVFILLLMMPTAWAQAQTMNADEILEQVDNNTVASNRVVQSKMVVHGRRSSRTMIAKSWISGEEKSFTEYLAPAREKGTKMLKLDDQLWTYSPSTDRIIRISGHMLRQSVMGSDLSFEDMMEDQELKDVYDAEIEREEVFNERACWVLMLKAKAETAYASRRIWIDVERFIPLKEDRYAKSGKLLKTTEIKEVMRVEERWVPAHMIFKDVLKKGKGTEYFIEEVAFDVDIPEHVFSKAGLRK